MAYTKVFTVAVTTTSGGAATGYTPTVSGLVSAIRYVPHASTPLDTNADATITCNTSGLPILTITDMGLSALALYPRAAVVSVVNVALLYSAGAPVADLIPVADEAIKIVIAQGGDTKSGTFYVYVDGS